MTPEVHNWVALALTFVIFMFGISLLPMLKNLVNEKFAKFEEHFDALETEAHKAILDGLGEIRMEQKAHRADQNAHPNLITFLKVEAKLEEVRAEIVELRVSLEARFAAARKVATARYKGKKA